MLLLFYRHVEHEAQEEPQSELLPLPARLCLHDDGEQSPLLEEWEGLVWWVQLVDWRYLDSSLTSL